MIKVLKKWSEIGDAIGYLYSLGKDKRTRMFHSTPVKNWDLAQIAKLLISKNRNCKILDMGFGGSNALVLLHKLGFSNMYGIDLEINFADRWKQLMIFKNNNLRLPYHLVKGNITNTNLPPNSFDFIICLSVIEHGVPTKIWLKEVSRILKKGGQAYISTDYWETKLNTKEAPDNYSGEWNILSKKELKQLVNDAKKNNLYLTNAEIPGVGKPIVDWNRMQYTFLSILFEKK